MKKLLIVLTFLMSMSSFAQLDCTLELKKILSDKLPDLEVYSTKYVGTIAPHSDLPYYQGEIWNDTDEELGIFEIKATYMAKFTYVALLRENCQAVKLIEVGFDD
ncbi:MAG TPA: hypothetical protein VI754_14580 [Bacteriovoracaceae bacterium]|nr:hypothetical protein [Bacteriovoracaceae bacterium]